MISIKITFLLFLLPLLWLILPLLIFSLWELFWFPCGLSLHGSSVGSLVLRVVLWIPAVPLDDEIPSGRSQGWTSLGVTSSSDPYGHRCHPPWALHQSRAETQCPWTSRIHLISLRDYVVVTENKPSSSDIWFFGFKLILSGHWLLQLLPSWTLLSWFCHIVSILSGHKSLFFYQEFYSLVYIIPDPISSQLF